MRFYEILEEGVIDIEGVRYFKNPTKVQVLALAAKTDLRGSSDGENVYVWDANVMIHHNARYWLRHDGNFYNTIVHPNGSTMETPRQGLPAVNFYVTNRKVRARRGTKESWTSKENIFYQLDQDTRLAVYLRGIWMENIPNFAAIVRGAPRSDQVQKNTPTVDATPGPA